MAQAASSPDSVLLPGAGSRLVPENTLKLPGGNAAIMRATAGSSRYSTPLDSTAPPTVPTQSMTEVRVFSSSRISLANSASTALM